MQTITLTYPVDYKGESVSELTMRRPKVRDQLIASKRGGDGVAFEIGLFADLCGVEPELLHALDMADYRALQDAYNGFFPEAPPSDPS